jgi:hypothetical protein
VAQRDQAQSGVCRGERIVNSIPPEREAGGKARPGRGAQRWRAILSEHPVITSIVLACTLIGAEGGVGCGLLITATRMIG